MRSIVLATLLLVLAGCGASSRSTINTSTGGSRPPGPTAATVAHGRLLVLFKRAFGQDPLASQLTVDTNGVAQTLITYGGINGGHEHVFTLPAAKLERLKRLIARSRLRDTWCCDARYYIYWVAVHHRGWRLQQHRIPPPDKALIDDLSAITAANTFY